MKKKITDSESYKLKADSLSIMALDSISKKVDKVSKVSTNNGLEVVDISVSNPKNL